MGTPETTREPCPDRILDDMGGAFAMGAVGGGAYHFLRGAKNSPIGHRLHGGADSLRMNAAKIGGSFAVWGGLFSVFDCSLVYLRRKEDPWNAILAGAATGGFLSARRGALAASRSALFGGVLLALIEGAGITMNKYMAANHERNMPVFMGPGQDPGMNQDPNLGSSWFGRWFGEKKEEGKGSEVKEEVLESFDLPMPPTFEFK